MPKQDLDDKETKRHLEEIFHTAFNKDEIYKKRVEKKREQIKEDKEASFCL